MGSEQGHGRQAPFVEVEVTLERKGTVLHMKALRKTCLLAIIVISLEAVETYLFCSPWDHIKKSASLPVQFVCGVLIPMGFLKIRIQFSDGPVLICSYHGSMSLPCSLWSLDGPQLAACLKDPAQRRRTQRTREVRAPATRVEFVGVAFVVLLHGTSCFHSMEFQPQEHYSRSVCGMFCTDYQERTLHWPRRNYTSFCITSFMTDTWSLPRPGCEPCKTAVR